MLLRIKNNTLYQEDRQQEVIEQISDTEHAQDIRELLSYDEDSACKI